MPRVINVSVNGEFISKDNSVGGVQGEGNATNLHLVFDASWAGYGKRVIWRNAQGEDPVAVILTHSPEEMAEPGYDELVFDTPIPTEPLKLPGWCTFTIEGYKDDDVKAVALTVSDSLKVIFNDSFYAPGEPTPSQADQIMAEIAKIEPQMEAFAKEAKSWAVGGTGSREGEDTDNAKYYAGQAKQSAQDAEGSAGAAEASAEAAKDSENAAGASAGAAASSAAAAASSAGAASQSASAASGSAGAAAGSAQEAKDSASAAKASETAAENAKLAAEQAKSDAENSASAAEQSKVSAENSKNIASQKATEAGESAVLAENAKTGAEQAKEGAEEAQKAIENMLVEAITLATGQPATVTKSLVNQVVKLTFGLPRGEKGETGTKGDQGVGITSVERTSGTGAPGTKDTYTVSLSDGSSYTFQVYNGANGSGSGDFMADGSVPMSGNLQMGGNRVTGLGAPQEDGDAARKADLIAEKITFSDGENFQQKYDNGALNGKPVTPIDLGVQTVGQTFTITAEQMDAFLSEAPPDVLVTIEGRSITLRRYDKDSDTAYYSNVICAQEKKHFITMQAVETSATITSVEEVGIPTPSGEADKEKLLQVGDAGKFELREAPFLSLSGGSVVGRTSVTVMNEDQTKYSIHQVSDSGVLMSSAAGEKSTTVTVSPERIALLGDVVFNAGTVIIPSPTTADNPTTKAYVDSLVGDINSALDAINGEVV